MKNAFYKNIFTIFFLTTLLAVSSCELKGFSEPYTLDTKIPDGTVEYKAGWRAGCRSALSAGKQFTQGWLYDPTLYKKI